MNQQPETIEALFAMIEAGLDVDVKTAYSQHDAQAALVALRQRLVALETERDELRKSVTNEVELYNKLAEAGSRVYNIHRLLSEEISYFLAHHVPKHSSEK